MCVTAGQSHVMSLNIGVTLVSSILYQVLPLIRIRCAQGVSKTLRQTSGVTSPHQNREKVAINVCPQEVSEVQPTAQQHIYPNPLLFFICRDT